VRRVKNVEAVERNDFANRSRFELFLVQSALADLASKRPTGRGDERRHGMMLWDNAQDVRLRQSMEQIIGLRMRHRMGPPAQIRLKHIKRLFLNEEMDPQVQRTFSDDIASGISIFLVPNRTNTLVIAGCHWLDIVWRHVVTGSMMLVVIRFLNVL
jgi:hypothetical protein